jgi:hypothetical protein
MSYVLMIDAFHLEGMSMFQFKVVLCYCGGLFLLLKLRAARRTNQCGGAVNRGWAKRGCEPTRGRRFRRS